jgi:hypothetical protein
MMVSDLWYVKKRFRKTVFVCLKSRMDGKNQDLASVMMRKSRKTKPSTNHTPGKPASG